MRFAREDLRRVRAAVRVAEEMARELGRGDHVFAPLQWRAQIRFQNQLIQ